MSDAPGTRPAARPIWWIALATALAYAIFGWLALKLAIPPGYASPLYPPAGLALAAVLAWGRAALPGVALGAFLVNATLSALRGQIDVAAVVLPAVIGLGAMLQAGIGGALVRRFVAWPLVLAGPRDIVRAGLLGGPVACLTSCTLATLALRFFGAIDDSQIASTWGTWWVGDSLGVLIGAPIVLTAIGRPRADWAARRRSVALPLLVASALLGAATLLVARWDEQRLAGSFAGAADRLASEADARLQRPLDALQAVHSAYLAAGGLNEAALAAATHWWLAQPMELQALGYSELVPRAQVPAFEARAQAEGLAGYHVFERDPIAAQDPAVLALRLIEPNAGNASALGVNVLSIPAARSALESARDSGAPVATRVFRLTQSPSAADQTGIVVYLAVYDGRPADSAARRAAWHGVVFVTVRAARLLSHLEQADERYLHWCLIDRDTMVPNPRLAGAAGCEKADLPERAFVRAYPLAFASRSLELRVWARPDEVPGHEQANAWLFSVVGLLAAAMLGALLLTVTGRARRIEQAVEERTAELRREVQERSQAEQALRESEARQRSILDNVPIGVLFLDTVGRIVATNPRLCEMLGRPADRLLATALADLWPAEVRAENGQRLAALLAGEVETLRRTTLMLRAGGGPLQVRIQLSLLRDEGGAPRRVAGVVEDISEHLRLETAERAREHAEAASRAKSEFVSRMSHELRTPLNAMIGFAQLLGIDREPALDEHQREWTSQIQRAGWHLLEMINDTLDLSRIESGAVQVALRPVEVAAVIDASLSLVDAAAQARAIGLRAEYAPGADAVLADETRLKQVLTNLLSNAVKYNRDAGSVTVRASAGVPGFIAIEVRDTGLGMSPEQMAALFQPYNRLGRENTPIEGTGIGLVIARRLVELMGGSLEASSSVGQGSVFTVRLPQADTALAAGAAQQHAAPAARGRRLVHYIEDNETNVEVMRAVLAQRPQIDLEVSMFGLDALSAIRQRHPDLILLDMHLPDISGIELLRHFGRDDDLAAIPVIVVSADATTARMQEALTLGAARYVTKPISIGPFLDMIDEILQGMDSRWGA